MPGQNSNLVHVLKSALGEKKYREYKMGFGDAVHHNFLVKLAIEKIAIFSSSRQTWWLLKYITTILQHLVSRWVHSGYRKHFQTFHPGLHDGTAVHLMQNVGDPSDRWISKTLKKSLGLDPIFLAEHLAIVYDGSWARLNSNSSKTLRCTSAWHVRAVLSDQPMLQFGPWSTSAPSERAKLATVSFQQTDKGSCK